VQLKPACSRDQASPSTGTGGLEQQFRRHLHSSSALSVTSATTSTGPPPSLTCLPPGAGGRRLTRRLCGRIAARAESGFAAPEATKQLGSPGHDDHPGAVNR